MEFLYVIYLILILIIQLCYSQNYDKENLKKLTEYRQQHRKTVDGRLCAAAFVQDDQTYTDCTKATDPNGITGKEWCYVEVQLIGKGNRDWDYCKGVINYDIVRSKARTFFQAKSNELSSAVNKLDEENKKLGSIYEKYQEICGTTSELLKKKIHEINDIAKNSSRNINKLLLLASSISDTETKMYELIDEVEKNRKSFLENKRNCGILKGYIVEERANGLIGSYYDNAYFTGYPTSINNDKYLNFIWDTGVPVENIPYQHFSIRWDGYLKIPQTDNYVIIIEHDCGVRIFLDNSPIIVDNMPHPKEDESEENRPISILPIEKINANVHKVSSEKLGLIGGKKYKFRVEYFHLSTIKYENPDIAHIILYWKSDNIAEEIIPTNYFFQGNVTSPLRITELKGDEFEIILLENGTYSFMNSLDYIITDIPTIHEKAKGIRTRYDFSKNIVKFKINVFSTVFIAIPQKNDIPFNEVFKKKFVNTKETLSIYQVQNTNTKESKQNIYNIYSSDYHEGDVVITFPKSTPFIIFVEQKELRSTNSCKGYVQAVSLTNSVYFDSCYSSSYESEKFDCNAGFSGNNEEKEHSTWKTSKNKSLGQYININFKNDIDIHSFTFRTLTSTENVVKEISLYFPNLKSPEVFLISPGHHNYNLKIPIKTKTVKAVISKVNDSKSQSGGNITFYGIPCIDSKNQIKILEEKKQYEINVFFRSKNVNILKPLNWLIDNGLKKQSHGAFKYGWEKLPTPIGMEHLDKKDLSHAGISFHPIECNNDSCDTFNKWSIDLLHEGMYYVTIEIGSPTGRQELNSIKVNDQNFINDIFLKSKQYTKVTGDVNINKNKTLEISTNTNTVIQSLQILFLHK
ncbi:LCCL-like protein, putative [Plasmodium gallinaceum]|uniref:LCCL-like protein, putative n=1 Tax=Plasmodium gallinaceum TaxID=5849 RepID=A0A1J1GQC9_PLAGA|nr:LCCL-like protein, putative [Plasmodium gallinaceum]CRG94711.1 LCCL-like protein, putative [Plasmodium gallinaceum]